MSQPTASNEQPDYAKSKSIYDPLPRGKWIRLMRLLPGSLEQPIDIEFFAIDLEAAPQYEAISYCWVDANHRTGITCSDSQFEITVSLFGALRRFRDDSLPRILWADAVCIDQSDVEEKSHQVNLMGEIYGCASRVLIWLGEDPDGDAGEGLQFIKYINRHFGREVLNISAKQEPQSQMSISRTIHDLPALADNSPLLSLTSWQIFKSLLSRPYFSRVWVLQEVGLAEEAWAFVGEESIQLSEIVQACLLTSFHSELALVPVNLPTGRILDTCSNIWSGFGRERSWLQELPILQQYTAHCVAYLHALTIVDVLNTARRFQASEPCDYVYALLAHPLAILPGQRAPLVRADYAADVGEMYMDFAFKCCVGSKSLHVLSSVQHEVEDDLDKAASWAPRWNMDFWITRINQVRAYNASLEMETKELFIVERLENRLKISGILFDSVELVSAPMEAADFKEHSSCTSSNHVVSPVESCWRLIMAVASIHKSKTHAVMMVLITGTYISVDNVKADFESYCRRFCSTECCQSLGLGAAEEDRETSGWRSRRFLNYIQRRCPGRRFYTTRSGRFGIGPRILKKGDLCSVLFGSEIPFILRQTGEKSSYKLLGEAYVEGVMHGEVVRDWQGGLLERKEIILV